MPRRIAIVEDDPAIRTNYADALRKHGFEVLAFASRGGPLTLDLKRFSVAWRGTAIPLTLTEFWMVHALAKFPEHVKSREQLMREANLVVDDGTVTSHVKRIRRKFLAADPAFDAIDTAYGMGYRWKV